MRQMDPSNQQDQFGQAYFRAVVARAGFMVQPGPSPDLDSIDFTVCPRGPLGTVRSPKLDVQLKTWRGVVPPDEPTFGYELKVKNHNDLCPADFQSPRILVLIVLPSDPSDWIAHSEQEMSLRRCGYWLSLRGRPHSQNASKVTVKMQRSQLFDAAGLAAIMNRVGMGALP